MNESEYRQQWHEARRLIVPKPIAEMTGKELEKVWTWLKKEYENKNS